jgi:bacillithiol biosynthesis cysteine-adding enzyme BshC
MSPHIQHIPHAATGRFSRIVLDYLADAPELGKFYKRTPDWAGIGEAIKVRKALAQPRTDLYKILEEQYAGLRLHQAVSQNLEALVSPTTFTVCTAHQPNLATGYLYFIYKILHAVRLAEDLTAQHPGHHFVPVYYMGSEDADLQELGTFRYGEKKFIWNGAGQKGAVGRMRPDGLEPLLDELFSLLGPPGEHTDHLKNVLRDAYLGHNSIAAATRYLVNELLGEFGVIVLDADHHLFKRAMRPVFHADLFRQPHEGLVQSEAARLSAAGYDAQAYPRAVNLFYLTENSRERIEVQGDRWVVLNSHHSFSAEELEEELDAHPERFSPNVVLRPLLQETILPNVAFIGGGAEVAYWLQLGSLFEQHSVPFPPVILRASAQWIYPQTARLQDVLGLEVEALFAEEKKAIETILSRAEGDRWRMNNTRQTLQNLEPQLRAQVSAIDATLSDAAGAAVQAMQRQLARLEAKALRAEKRRHKTDIERWQRLRAMVFPGGGFQERVENFLPYYAKYGPAFFSWIKTGIDPLGKSVLVGTLP